jgi:hypothetical protein
MNVKDLVALLTAKDRVFLTDFVETDETLKTSFYQLLDESLPKTNLLKNKK